MPPKEKVSKAQVQETAFEMTREMGFNEVTARKLAERLGCSTQPIFRAYENMDELRTDLFFMSTEYFTDYMFSKKNRNQPSYLSVGMAYIEMALNERHLFELIASVNDYGVDALTGIMDREEMAEFIERLPETDHLTPMKKQELFMMVWSFTHGLASMVVGGRLRLNNNEIKSMLTKAYEGFVTAESA